MGRQLQSIYEFLSDCTREEIDAVIETLTTEEKEILRMRYGDDLNNPVSQGELPSKVRDKFYKGIIPKIRTAIKGPIEEKTNLSRLSKKTIYEVLSDYSREEIDTVIKGLNDKDKKLLLKRYGEDLNNPTPSEEFSRKENNCFSVSLLPKIRKKIEKSRLKREKDIKEIPVSEQPVLLQKNKELKVISEVSVQDKNIQKEVYMDILTSLTNIPFSKMLENLSISEAIIFALKIGGAKKYFTDSEIADFFAISEEEVRETTKKGLMVYQDRFVEFIDTAISVVSEGNPKQRSTDQFVKTLSDKPKS